MSSRNTKRPRPARAIRWWKKRSVAIFSWLRLLMVRPSWAASGSPGVSLSEDRSSGGGSGIADPRVKQSVSQVCDDVEDDHGGGRNQQPGLHHVHVRAYRAGQAAEQEAAHALPAERDLGDHRAADDGREVERDHGGDRDEGVPERVDV